MMNADDIRNRFLDQLRRDQEHAGLRDLDAYLQLFPEGEDLIREEYDRVHGASAESRGDGATLVHGGSGGPGLRNRVIGGYRLIRELGHGGQGYVYLAEDKKLRRQVALKLLPHAMSFSESARLRFEREAEVASKLDHPGICTVYETGEEDGIPFIAMQLVEGEALDRKIKSSKAAAVEDLTHSHIRFESSADSVREEEGTTSSESTPRSRAEIMEVVRFMEDAARAMHAAHEAGLIHRDIKPGNIMAGSDGRAVILDFGLARDELAQLVTLTQSGDLMGTPSYMAPEQLTANRIKLDRRADVYALGVTLYECLTLRRPFEAGTREALYQAIQFKEAPDPRGPNPAIGMELKVVLETAMEKDRDRRYGTALELAEELRRVRQYEPIQARPAGPILRLRRWTQRNPVPATSMLIVFVAISTVAGVLVVKNRQVSERALEVERQSELKDEALKKQKAALSKERAALTEKSRALKAYDRLADVTKLREAQAEADVLWPARPRKVAAIEAWLAKYGVLAEKLAGHEVALKELRLLAEPYTETDRERDHAETILAITALEEERKALEAEEETTRSGNRRDEIEERLEEIPDEHLVLQTRHDKRLSWRFAGKDADAQGWKHEVLAKLVSDLRMFVSVAGALVDVCRRLELARSMRARTVDAYQEIWDDALARLRVSDRYGKLDLKAQVGLIPLGADPVSGLEEFLHFESHIGSLPERVNGSFEVTGETGVILILLPGGTFQMGVQSEDVTKPNYDPYDQLGNEIPVHEVTLAPFFLAKYELTRGQWLRVSGREDPSHWVADTTGGTLKSESYRRHPVEGVSWEECDRVTLQSGIALPTEAQWEFGCRGRTSTVWYFGDDKAEMKNHGNVADLSFARAFGDGAGVHEKGWEDGYAVTAPVGSFAANGFGLHDVLGNVSEWCRDWLGDYATEPVIPMTGMRQTRGSLHRAIRGGAFNDPPHVSRAAFRYGDTPGYRGTSTGVRPARATF